MTELLQHINGKELRAPRFFFITSGVGRELNTTPTHNHGGFLFRSFFYMGVSKNRGTPKWMVKICENHGKPYFLMDDLGRKPPYFWKPPIFLYCFFLKWVMAVCEPDPFIFQTRRPNLEGIPNMASILIAVD